MIGTTLAHYRITSALGAGGMGEVWRATDEKLGREVALKLLPAEFADDTERLDRFEREARAVASLNHPHIVTIFSVEDAGGIRFLTMELVDGQTLDSMIPEHGFDAETFFELATPLAEAISAAHDKSVIHRDLKPSNVMVDGNGRVKVMDFGLAKLQAAGELSDSSELATEALTGVGTIVGTVPYMSPEQVEGKIVDHRTDIFSLGVLLYEMATGERPFQGESSVGLMSSILRDAPAPVGQRRDDLPNHLGRIVSRCLEKNRRDRYQTARDIFNELKALRRESTATGHSRPPVVPQSRSEPQASASSSQIRRSDVPWIAVLPFGCPAGDSEIETFSDGLEGDIATGISRFSYLFVVARKSTRRYRGEATDVRQVGEELGARYVMEGSVRRAGSRIRLGMNLIDAETGTHLWSETYDRDLEAADVFDLQDELTDRVVATVADPHGALTRSMAIDTESKAPDSLTTNEAILRLFLYRQRTSAEDHLVTRRAVEAAAERDPNNAELLAALASLCIEEANHDFNPRPDPLDRALAIARRAVEADPSSQLAHFYLAQAYFHSQNLSGFRAAANRALELNRRSTDTMAMLGILFGYAGDFEKGVELASKAMELNPLHPGWYRFSPFMKAYLQGRDAEALEIAQQINMPEYWGDPLTRTLAHAQLGNQRAAEAAARDLLRVWPDFEKDYKRVGLDPWVYAVPELEARIVDGLAKAGLKVLGAERPQVESTGEGKIGSEPERGPVAIAVLPFTDMSPDKDQDYFCEGMAEEIMNALVRIEGIRVASRTSAFRARQEVHGLAEIAHLLSVGHVLEGSVRMAGSRLRVTAQLTEVANGYQLWSERFDRELEDVFAVQDEIAAGVVEAVESRLAPGERTILARPQARNLEAYRSYLLGQHLRYAKEDHGGAVRAFQEAVRLDPAHAPSWTGLAESLALSAHMSLIPSHEACAGAREALSTALELQGESPDGLHGEAFVAFIERRWKDLEAAVRRAIEIEPSHVPSLGLLGMCLSLHQKPDEAEPFFERAMQADPLASFPYMLTALGLLTARRPQEAHRYAEQALTFEKEDASALFCSSLANVALGHFEEGIVAAEGGVAVSHRGADFLGLLGWALATAGRKDEARVLLEELRTRPAAAPPIVSEGWLLGALGEIDAAFEVLARAENENQLWLYYTGLPGFDSLRADQRFDAHVECLGLPPLPSCERIDSVDASESSPEKSIAVLPFVNMSADPENEYFSDGLSEEIINALTRLPGLRVIARTSAFRFRGEQDLRKVGAALGVQTLLEGSVRKAGQNLRITAQLIDVADDSHIWSERFDRELVDVFAIQDEISAAIVDKLHLSLGAGVPAKRERANVAALDALLEARHFFFQFTPAAAEQSLTCIQKALSLEPDYPDALALQVFYNVMMGYMFADPREVLPQARSLAERALELDPHHGEAQAAVAILAGWMDRDWSGAESHYHRALELAPASARIHELYGLGSLLAMGRLEESLLELDRAVELDPLSALYAGNRGRVLTCARRFAEAEATCRRGLALDPGQLLAQVELIYALTFQQRFEEAIAIGRRAIDDHGPGKALLNALALSLALAGEHDEAWQLIDAAAEPGSGAYRSPLTRALVHAVCSEMDAAFEYVQRAIDEYEPMLWYLRVHPMFDALRDDPRYPDLLQELNLHERSRQ